MESDEAIRRRFFDNADVRARVEAVQRDLDSLEPRPGITAEELPEFLRKVREAHDHSPRRSR